MKKRILAHCFGLLAVMTAEGATGEVSELSRHSNFTPIFKAIAVVQYSTHTYHNASIGDVVAGYKNIMKLAIIIF